MEIRAASIRWIIFAMLVAAWMAAGVAAQTPSDNAMPDAPDAAWLNLTEQPPTPFFSSSSLTPAEVSRQTSTSEITLRECPYDNTHARDHVASIAVLSSVPLTTVFVIHIEFDPVLARQPVSMT